MAKMNYKLAKQLRDAGFSQELFNGDWYYADGGEEMGMLIERSQDGPVDDERDDTKIPTLSELIEACGDKLYILKRRGIGGNAWEAKDYEGNYGHSSKTPEEAVAKLWLKLNE